MLQNCRKFKTHHTLPLNGFPLFVIYLSFGGRNIETTIALVDPTLLKLADYTEI